MPRPFPAALLLPGDAFDIDSHQVMGRRVAGRSFARGLVGALQSEEQLTILLASDEEKKRLSQLLDPVRPPGSALDLVLGFEPARLVAIGALHVPDPGLARWSLLRAGRPASAFSLTGVIHTLCSHTVVSTLEQLSTAPLEPWDALVCTSRAGQAVVKAAMACQHQVLERRFGMSLPQPPGPQLPVIPLAVADSLPLESNPDRELCRRAARQQLGLDVNAHVVLFLGRLSFHSKGHPLVLYRALARLAADHPEVLLLECGHLYNTHVAAAFEDLQRCFPQLPLRRLGGLTPATEEEKALALAAADVFVSPADNLQETFGLSVIEAMAAGLPTVVSDWNGYRDLVVHGQTGFLIPTSMDLGPPEQLDALDRTYRLGLIDYDTMVGLRSLSVVVEEEPLLTALRRLHGQPMIRQQMGKAARQRWQELFSWPVVAEQYRQLWLDLAALRNRCSSSSVEASAFAGTGRLFAEYPTRAFQVTPLRTTPLSTPPAWLRRPMQLPFFAQLCGKALDPLIQHLERHSQVDQQQLQQLGVDPAQCRAVLAALVKFGVAVPFPSAEAPIS